MPVIEIEDKAVWDRFIDDSPSGMLFHKWDFLKTVEKFTGGRLSTYGVYRDGLLFAVMPVFYQKVYGVRIAYSPPQSSMAYVQYLGIVIGSSFDWLKQYEKENDLYFAISELDRTIRKKSINYINIGLTPFYKDARPFQWTGYGLDVLYTYTIDLRQPLEQIWDGFDRECKKHINISAKSGLRMERTDDVETVFRIMKEGMVEKHTFFHMQSPAYLKELLSRFPDNIEVQFAYSGSEIAGIFTAIRYKDRYSAWIGTTPIKGHEQSNEFMVWEHIKKAKAEGYRTFENAGGDERRLNPFKSKFNPSLEIYFTAYKKDALFNLAKSASGALSYIHGRG